MKSSQDTQIIKLLKEEHNNTFEILYKRYFPTVSSYIKRNNGNEADAEDIFQETIIVLLEKIRQPDFLLTSSLKTYLFAISRNLWLKRLRDNKTITTATIILTEENTDSLFEDTETEREELLSVWMKRITINCQKILNAIFFHKTPMESLIKKMGWKNKHTAANQQYKCIQQVKKQSSLEKEI